MLFHISPSNCGFLNWMKIYVAKPHEDVEDKKGIMKDLAVLTGGEVQTVNFPTLFSIFRIMLFTFYV